MGIIFCSILATGLSFDNKHVDSIADRKNSAIVILLVMGTTKANGEIQASQSLIYQRI